MIEHPALTAARRCGWHWDWQASCETRRAVEEGWSHWIRAEVDEDAVRKGCWFDISKWKGGQCFWHPWQRITDRGEYQFGWRWLNEAGDVLIDTADFRELFGEERRYGIRAGKGDHACRFIDVFVRHVNDPWKGQPFILLPWQRVAMLELFGWQQLNERNKAVRRFDKAYWEIPKKNGKSFLVAAITMLLMAADGTVNAKLFGVAKDSKQASQVLFDPTLAIVRYSLLADQFTEIESQRVIKHPESGGEYRLLSKDSGAADGRDALAILFDELHVHTNRELLAAVKYSGDAREQSLTVIITTSGRNLKSVWGEERQKALDIINGKTLDINTHAFVATAEPWELVVRDDVEAGATEIPVVPLFNPIEKGDVLKVPVGDIEYGESAVCEATITNDARRRDRTVAVEPLRKRVAAGTVVKVHDDPEFWKSEFAIRISNPSLHENNPDTGGTITLRRRLRHRDDAIAGQAVDESDDPIADYKRLLLNIPTEGEGAGLNYELWKSCGERPVDWESLRGQPCWCGYDKGSTLDLSAFWFAFPSWGDGEERYCDEPYITLLGLAWTHSERLEDRSRADDIDYASMARRDNFAGFGYVRITEGAAIDDRSVVDDILAACDIFNVRGVGYDPHNALAVIRVLEQNGIPCIMHRQGEITMGPATKEVRERMAKRQLAHGNNPLLNHAVKNAVLSPAGRTGLQYPVKNKSRSRIDALIACVMACNFAINPPETEESGAWSGEAGAGIWG